MAVDPTNKAATLWQAADLVVKGRWGLTKMDQLLNNQNALINLIDLTRTAWDGSDVRDHFAESSGDGWATHVAGSGSVTHDEANHLFTIQGPTASNDGNGIHLHQARRPDRVNGRLKWRFKMGEAWHTLHEWFSGFLAAPSVWNTADLETDFTDGVYVIPGTATDTIALRTKNGSSIVETSADISSVNPWGGWVELVLDLDETQGQLRDAAGNILATNTISIPSTALLTGAWHIVPGGNDSDFDLDLIELEALENEVSP